MINKIFLDMDGVLSDFNGLYRSLFNRDHDSNDDSDDDLYESVIHKRYFTLLSRLPRAHELVDFLFDMSEQSNIPIVICSSLGSWSSSNHYRDIESRIINQKMIWLEKNFQDHVFDGYCFPIHGKDKALFASPGAVLIDDNFDNCLAFKRAGGDYFDYEPTHLDSLKKFIMQMR